MDMYDDKKLEEIFTLAAKERAEVLGALKIIQSDTSQTKKGVDDLTLLAHEMDRRITRLETVVEKDGTSDDIRELYKGQKATDRDLAAVKGTVSADVATVKGTVNQLRDRILIFAAISGFLATVVVQISVRLIGG